MGHILKVSTSLIVLAGYEVAMRWVTKCLHLVFYELKIGFSCRMNECMATQPTTPTRRFKMFSDEKLNGSHDKRKTFYTLKLKISLVKIFFPYFNYPKSDGS